METSTCRNQIKILADIAHVLDNNPKKKHSWWAHLRHLQPKMQEGCTSRALWVCWTSIHSIHFLHPRVWNNFWRRNCKFHIFLNCNGVNSSFWALTTIRSTRFVYPVFGSAEILMLFSDAFVLWRWFWKDYFNHLATFWPQQWTEMKHWILFDQENIFLIWCCLIFKCRTRLAMRYGMC